MNWKRYKALPPDDKFNDTYYIIGLDIGAESSAIAFYNLHEHSPEPIDLSGGYGKPSIPTVMQYIAETKEWVFGEYAILNQGAGTEITLKSLVRRLGHFDYLDVGSKSINAAAILGIFIKEMLASVRNINPRAEIVGIVAAVPAYFSQQAHEELRRAFKHAGYEKELIALVPDRECIFALHYMNAPPKDEKVLLLDYGSQEVRGGVYHLLPDIPGDEIHHAGDRPAHRFTPADFFNGEHITAKSLSSLFDENIGTGMISEDVHALFESYYQAATRGHEPDDSISAAEQITAFAHQHKDMLFQKNIRVKPAKLYFNFVYPPFQQTITHAEADALIKPYRQRFNRFIRDTLEKTLGSKVIPPRSINTVLCIGGGFEMLWAREAVGAIFTSSQIHIYRNTKLATAEGAALVAAKLLGIARGCYITVEDKHQLVSDIGLKSGDAFLPLVEHGRFWWQKHKPTLVLANNPVDGELHLQLAKRTATGETLPLAAYNLTGLPTRPKGTTRLKFDAVFESHAELSLSVEDMGFGELFPKTDYVRELTVRLG